MIEWYSFIFFAYLREYPFKQEGRGIFILFLLQTFHVLPLPVKFNNKYNNDNNDDDDDDDDIKH